MENNQDIKNTVDEKTPQPPTAAETVTEEKEETVNFAKYVDAIKHYWWVMAACVILFVGLAVLYIKVKSPVYSINAMVMMNQNDDDEGGGIPNGTLGMLMSSFSLGSTSVNIEDEIFRLTSHSSLKQVVKEMDLNTEYWTRDSYLQKKKSYFNDSPIKISMPESVLDTLSVLTNFEISIPQTGTPLHISVKQDGSKVLDTEIHKMPCVVKTPYGEFDIAFTPDYKPGREINIKANVVGYEEAIDELKDRLSVNQSSRKANAVTLDLEDYNIERGKAVLNRIIANYNQQGIDDKNRQALMSAKFIEDRLVKIYRELHSSEADIENYKRQNSIVDPSIEAEYAFKLKGSVEEKALEIQTKAGVLKMLRDYLKTPANYYSLVPFAEDLPEVPIEKYNELVLERMRLESTMKNTDNPTLKTLENQIDAMRSNIISSLDKQIQSANIAVNDINRQIGVSNARLKEAPIFERELLDMYRDQEIKNRIYGFLLQKREENELKLSKNVPKAVIIDEAYALLEPIKPKKGMILGGAFLLSIIVGAIISMYLQKRHNKKHAAKEEKKEATQEQIAENITVEA